MPKLVSVVGGAGFVGTNLCQYLSDRQIPFEIIDLRKSTRFPEKSKIGDVRDLESLKEVIHGDVVVNLAAVHRDDVLDKREYFETNVKGSENIGLVCEYLGIKKIVFTSSVAVYGFAEEGTDETGEIAPFNEYGRTKFEAEERLRKWGKGADRSLIIVRPTVIFGEGNRGNVFNLFNQIASGRFAMIGAGKNKKSMAYVGNVVAFLEHCIASNEQYAVVNYVDTPDMDMNELVTSVSRQLGNTSDKFLRLPFWLALLIGRAADLLAGVTAKKFPISAIRVQKFCATTSFGTSLAAFEDFRSPFSLQEGIERTIRSEFLEPDPTREIFYTE
jgi:nucleoside-diphosphate-sugar epimerase